MPDFLQTFTDRRECFAELLKLSREQCELVDGDDYPRLLSLLGSKQRVIGRLEEIGKSRPKLGQEWHSRRDELPAISRQECDHVLHETEVILAELLIHERMSAEHLTRRRDETRLQLSTIAAGAEAQTAYHDNLAPVTHRHLNVDQ